MPSQNVELTEHQAEFIRESVDKGHYKDASEMVSVALHLLEESASEEEAKLEALRAITKDAFDALDRGEYVEHTPESIQTFIADVFAEVKTRHRS